jgi:hypothetical protein|tara:strand:- start:316 stop:552 length:237 start_codon:yes stop_codon:yes gene_type:complete
MYPLFDRIVGPISSEACVYFYVVALLSFFLLVLSLLGLVLNLIKKPKSFSLQSLIVPVNAGLMYFVNRVLYNMCVGSL